MFNRRRIKESCWLDLELEEGDNLDETFLKFRKGQSPGGVTRGTCYSWVEALLQEGLVLPV